VVSVPSRYAVPNTFILGIAAAMLAALYHYLMARSFLELTNGAVGRYAAGESTLQTLFFSLIAQTWVRRWDWQTFPVTSDATTGFTVCALILALVLLINWIFQANVSGRVHEVCDPTQPGVVFLERRYVSGSSAVDIDLVAALGTDLRNFFVRNGRCISRNSKSR